MKSGFCLVLRTAQSILDGSSQRCWSCRGHPRGADGKQPDNRGASTSLTASLLNALVDALWTFVTIRPFPIELSLSHSWGLSQIGQGQVSPLLSHLYHSRSCAKRAHDTIKGLLRSARR